MTLLEALSRPDLFGAFFQGESWSAWRAFLAAVFGLDMTGEQHATYVRHTGREQAPRQPAKEAWVVAGRRGGKSRIAALTAVWLATRDHRPVLAAGEVGTLPIIAADRRQARTVMGYVNALLDGVPLLAKLVVARTAESVTLATRVRLEVHTASFRSVRGYTVVGAICDEVAYWRSEDSLNADTEIVNALRPAMSTVPGALLLAISSPYARRGVLWDAYRRHFGKDGTTLVWQADTRSMNPRVDEAIIASAYEEDEAAASAEYGAEFRRDIESFVQREALEACVVPGRAGLPPVKGTAYVAFCDPSGGSSDSFTLAIAHHENGRAVLDFLSERRPPFSPEQVVSEYAEMLKSYGVTRVQADKYAGQWVVEAFGKHHVTCEQSAEPKSVLYGNVLPLLNSQRCELLDHPRLQHQLLGLERRTARGGRDSIDHAPGGHDDLANAAAGALLLAAQPGDTANIRLVERVHDFCDAPLVGDAYTREFGRKMPY